MGLDIYAGTLTRYYAQNWMTAAQQWAESSGMRFSRITPDGAAVQEAKPDPGAVREDMENWRNFILAAISQEGRVFAPWEEDNEKPYYTDKPDWDAFGALLLYAACRLYGEPLPPTVEKNWDYHAHPLIKRLTQDAERRWSLFIGTEWWLPLEDAFYFTCPTPAGEEKIVSTAGALRAELQKLNEVGWQAEESAVLEWSTTEGYPAEGTVENGVFIPGVKCAAYETESLAKFAYSLFYRAQRFSRENKVPILLDY